MLQRILFAVGHEHLSENCFSVSTEKSLATSESRGCVVACKGTHSYNIHVLHVVN